MGKITTIVDLTVAAAEGDWQKVGRIVADEAISKVATKTTQKIENQVATWNRELQQGLRPRVPERKDKEKLPTVIVDARLEKLKEAAEAQKIEIEQNKLPIPERELIENNNKVTPALKPKEEKPKEEEQKRLRDTEASNSERLTAIDRDKDYLSAADKAVFDQVVNEKYSTSNPEQIKQRQDNIAKLEAAIQANKKIIQDSNINAVIAETKAKRKDYTSQYTLTENEAINADVLWVGKEHSRIDDGVYRSNTPNPDGTYNQYRMDNGSLDGTHNPHIPHVHLQIIKITKITSKTINGNYEQKPIEKSISNNHIPIIHSNIKK